ncbi:MAG: hypothetical protein QGH25_17505, partial [Candidatus Latescibacteria bacterium]|nr:hypothetical protein [Candidatus Latescibacterota bacterium]
MSNARWGFAMVEMEREAVGGLLPVRSGSKPSAAEEAVLAEQVEQFKSRGYTVLRGVLGAHEVAALRERLDARIDIKLGQ